VERLCVDAGGKSKCFIVGSYSRYYCNICTVNHCFRDNSLLLVHGTAHCQIGDA
jgi:hypothetical protein